MGSRQRSEWVGQGRWRQAYFVVGSVAIAALLGFVIEGRLVWDLIAFAVVGSVGAVVLERRRRL